MILWETMWLIVKDLFSQLANWSMIARHESLAMQVQRRDEVYAWLIGFSESAGRDAFYTFDISMESRFFVWNHCKRLLNLLTVVIIVSDYIILLLSRSNLDWRSAASAKPRTNCLNLQCDPASPAWLFPKLFPSRDYSHRVITKQGMTWGKIGLEDRV